MIGEGERRLRYVLCFNPEQAARQQAHRQYLLKEITAELVAMGEATQDVLSKRVAGLRSSRRYGKYLKLGDKGLELDAKAVKAAEHYDGKFIVHGNDDTRPQDKPVDGPCGVRDLTTAPRPMPPA